MVRSFSTIIWLLSFTLLATATGCAAQLKEMKGITRVGYSIQVGAFAEVKNAERLTANLQAKGIEAFYFKKENGVYAVRFGDYPNWEAARKGAQKLVADKVLGAYFIASPQDTYLARPKEPEIRTGGEPAPKPKAGRDMGAIAARKLSRARVPRAGWFASLLGPMRILV